MNRFILACGLACALTAGAAPNGLIIMLTDYGTDSIYVGILKGAMYSKHPNARIDAITNGIPPYDIAAGAYTLLEACGNFPVGTTFCCVVDPGVGSERKAIALETQNGYTFVAPDNGLLAPVAEKFGIVGLREATNTALWREGVVSSTFHGRDIFGPVSASLARGVPFDQVGPALEAMVQLDVPRVRIEDDAVHGTVLRADPYGNLISNIRAADLEAAGISNGDTLNVAIGGAHFAAPWLGTYSDAPEGERLVLVQSTGLIEFAINQGDLAATIGEGLHADVRVTKAP